MKRLPWRTIVMPKRVFGKEWWWGKDSNLGRRKPADLQSALVDRLSIPPVQVRHSIPKNIRARQLHQERKVYNRCINIWCIRADKPGTVLLVK